MPVRVEFDGRLIRATISETFGPQDLQELVTGLRQVEDRCAVFPPRLADLRTVRKVPLRASDILGAVELRRAQVLPNDIRTAILVSLPLQVGYARMFQTLLNHRQIEVRIFSDEAEALAWLLPD